MTNRNRKGDVSSRRKSKKRKYKCLRKNNSYNKSNSLRRR